MIKKYFFTVALLLSILTLQAQPSLRYWNKASYLKITGGTLVPGPDMKSSGATGLFAQDGYQIGFDYNYMIAMGLGLGVNLEFDHFRFDKDAFFETTQADFMTAGAGYNSAKFGLNAIFNLPIVVHPKYFTINFFIEGNAGLRGMSIPIIDLEYNEIDNKYVEVSYRPRNSSMTYLGYSGGIQLLFANKFGINASYNVVEPSRHSIRYSVRMFDDEGELFTDENYLNNYLDHTGLQFGILFLFGANR